MEISQTGSSNKVKSQRGGQVEVLVRNRVKWPHEFVLAGSIKERISYDQLTMTQWMACFCRTMREENDQNLRSHMLNYLINLLDDAQDFSWTAAKASHAVFLCRMEQGEVLGYDQVDCIDRIRRANVQKHVVGNPQFLAGPNNAKNNAIRPSRKMPCHFFNQGMCCHSATHETKGVLYKQVCSFCFTSANKTFPHTESECRNKKKNASKNEEARAWVILVPMPIDLDKFSPLVKKNVTLGSNWRCLKPPGPIGLEGIRLSLQKLIIGHMHK